MTADPEPAIEALPADRDGDGHGGATGGGAPDVDSHRPGDAPAGSEPASAGEARPAGDHVGAEPPAEDLAVAALPPDALSAPVAGADPAWPATETDVGDREEVPWRIIWAAIGIVLAAIAAIELVRALKQVIELIVISGFLAVVLSPAVSGLVRLKIRRGLATSIVFLFGILGFAGLGYLFIHPIYQQAVHFADDLPNLLARVQAGKGRLGELIARYHLQKTAAEQVPKIRNYFSHLGGPALTVAKQALSGLGALVTVLVFTFLMLLQGPSMVKSALDTLRPRQARRVRRILDDVAKSVTGYMLGNITTSFIAGLICGVSLFVLRVPFAVVFGVWVALVDFLPLVGGLLAGVPTVAFAALHSPTAGVIMLIVFLVYQQIENHILNPLIMSRTVKLNALWVILSVLAGAELAGIVGALLAIPAAGAIHVILRDMWDERRGEPKVEPTIGADQETLA